MIIVSSSSGSSSIRRMTAFTDLSWRWGHYNPPKQPFIIWHGVATETTLIWCDFDRASSLTCGNKMPTRCNRGFYCRSYFLLNMFRAPLCPSSGAQEYYTVVAACGIWCCGVQVAGLVWSWVLCVRFAGCCSILQTGHITLSFTPDQQLEHHSTKYHRQQPLYNTLELLMMGIVVPETCSASNKICNKNLCCI